MRTHILLRSQVRKHLQLRKGIIGAGNFCFRSFFASSTDHTTLLQNAVVHRLEEEEGGAEAQKKQSYVMAADGMDIDMVKKVPQLHLARIWRDGTTLEGAKVINSTLGTPTNVCGRLVDAALEDATKVAASTGNGIQAKATLHGLSDWVSNAIISQPDNSLISSLLELDETKLKVIEDIIENGSECDETVYNKGKDSWEKLAQTFIESNLADEAALYQSKGFKFNQILHLADTTPYASSCAGSMALYSFTN